MVNLIETIEAAPVSVADAPESSTAVAGAAVALDPDVDEQGRIVIAHDVSELFSESMEQSLSMGSAEERHRSAEVITRQARNAMLDVEAAKMRLDDLKAGLLQLLKMAYSGGAHLILGYANWDAYWKNEFSDIRLWHDAKERRDLAEYLNREGGFSTRMIAPILGISKDTVRNDIQAARAEAAEDARESSHDETSEQLANHSPVAQTSQDGTDRIRTAAGTEQSGKRGDMDVARDYALFEQLAEWGPDLTRRRPMTQRQIAEYLGVPQRTVSWTLTSGWRSHELAVLCCKAWDMVNDSDHPVSPGEAARRLSLHPLALHWLLDNGRDAKGELKPISVGFLDWRGWPPEQNSAVERVFLDTRSILPWVEAPKENPLVRCDGKAVTQGQLARLLGKTQSAVSQRLRTIAKELAGEQSGDAEKPRPLAHTYSPARDESLRPEVMSGWDLAMDTAATPEDVMPPARALRDEYFDLANDTGGKRLLERIDDNDNECTLSETPAAAAWRDEWTGAGMEIRTHELNHMGTFFNAVIPMCLPQAVERGTVTKQQIKDLWQEVQATQAALGRASRTLETQLRVLGVIKPERY